MSEAAEVYNWRSRSPSDKQIELLSRGSVLMEPGLTRGEASEIIEELMASGVLLEGLSLAALQAYDPQGGRGPGVEKRYCHPSDGKSVTDDHRDISVNMETGEWFCHSCQIGGTLKEWRTNGARRLTRAELSQARARQVFSLSNRESKPKTEPTPAEIEKENRWRGWWDASFPLVGTPGADYLAGRSISPELAAECGARFSGEWYGRPAVLFPVRDRAGDLVAVSGRFTDGRLPKTQAGGTISAGVFSTPGALEARCVAVVEGPIDALALWTCGVAAVAMIGTSWTEWLPRALAFKAVLIATDNDQGGEDCAVKLDPVMIARGARVLRLKPRCKDWAKVLEEIGVERLRPHLRGFAISPRLAFGDEEMTDDDVRICAARDLADVGRLPEAQFIIRLLDDLEVAEALRARLMN